MAVGGRGWLRWGPPLVAALVAGTAAGALAVHLAPRPDELHTLGHVHDPSLAAMWRSYRGAVDATPPAGYVLSWVCARVLGTSLIAVRVPYVACWAAAAGGLAVATRRAGPFGALAAGLVPSASALVYLGAYARPYAPAFAALTVAVVAWGELGRPDVEGRARRGWVVLLGLACGAAISIHYATTFAVLVLVAVAAVADRRRGTGAARWAAPLVGAAGAGVGILWVLGQAVDAQRTMARSVRPLDALAFWPSAALPALVVLVPAGAIVALLGIDRRRRGIGPVLAPELEVAGALIATVVPVAAVAAMLATSGIYFHRYGQAALVGVAIVVAAAIGPGSGTVAPARRALAGVVVGFLAAGVAMATLHTARSFVSERSARAMVAELGLDGGGSDEVFAIEEYDLLLLRHVAPPAVGSRMGLGALADGSSQAPGVVGSPERVDLVDRLAALEPGASIDLVGSPAELDPFRSGFEGTIVEVGTATFARPGADRELVHLRFTAR